VENVSHKIFKPNVLKQPGHYTKQQWRQLIDSVWGPGLPTADKLKLFDDFWTAIDQKWGGFHNLIVNWDSLKNVYRPEVAAGVSKGRFAAILSRLTMALNEMHSMAVDLDIDKTFGVNFLGSSSYFYQPGIPLFNTMGEFFLQSNFGAGLTPLPDSTALVYNVMPNHPLGLQAGDIILGYDGIPWMKLYKELLDFELPFLGSGKLLSSTQAAALHTSINSAGMNWGLFDTIDVKKYGTNEVLHYPTSLLSSIQPPYPFTTEQLPVPGVPFPDLKNNKRVSWGVISGTSIGYIYALMWNSTASSFTQAVDELMHKNNVQGMIIDFRTNGGSGEYAVGGFNHLFNFDPTPNYSFAIRTPGNDHFTFSLAPTDMQPLTPTPEIFDHPIAVLTGPQCRSAGDFFAHKMRFHPMVRFFGLPTNGAFAARSVAGEAYSGPYVYNSNNGSAFTTYFNEGVLIHKPFPVDEQVWLTRDGVAKGEDDVVKKAMEWINTLTHGCHLALAKNVGKYGRDTIKITATVRNPQNHALSVWSYLNPKENTTLFLDSCQMFDDGLHNDGKIGDSLFGGTILLPSSEGVFGVSLRTTDVTAGTFRHLPNIQRYFTNGPIVFKNFLYTTTDTIPNPGDAFRIKFRLGNNGKTDTVRNVIATVSALDTLVTLGSVSPISYGDIPPGKDSLGVIRMEVRVKPTCPTPATIRLLLNISSEGTQVWTDTVSILVHPTGVYASDNSIPTEFSLSQNYPNPFNPVTTIRYALPSSANVKLSVHDILGREIATLVNEEQSAGWKEVDWNASAFSSGIYFYKLQAGGFAEVKKLMLLK
jgi:hypothetical protein